VGPLSTEKQIYNFVILNQVHSVGFAALRSGWGGDLASSRLLQRLGRRVTWKVVLFHIDPFERS
jgi:hypothetical protein